MDIDTSGSPRKKLSITHKLYLIGTSILIVGLLGATGICYTAPDLDNDALLYGDSNASVYATMPRESKRYNYDLERIGGKSAVLAADLNDWFTGLWQGKELGYTLGFLSIVVALGCFWFGWLLSFQPVPDESVDGGGDIPPKG